MTQHIGSSFDDFLQEEGIFEENGIIFDSIECARQDTLTEVNI